jgi:hypothetical protein
MYLNLRRVGLLLALALPLAAEPLPSQKITVVLDFRGPYSADSVSAMKQEMQDLVKDAGVQLEWKTLDQASGEEYGDMVVVQFNGKCILKPVPYLYYDERGPLASTYSSDGKVLPFSEVSCEKVGASVQAALLSGDYARADFLLGRALGRVVAHELVHVLTNSGAHSREGVYSESLSGKQLISNSLSLSQEELKRIQADRRHGF